MCISRSCVIEALIIYLLIATCKSGRNNITVVDPNNSTSWFHGSTSYRISWTQTGHCFKWDIHLFDAVSSEKVYDIVNSLSEYKNGEMSAYWLIGSQISSGKYFVRVIESTTVGEYGDSQVFTITEQVEMSSNDQSFMPPSAHTNVIFTSNQTHGLEHLLPHELKHYTQLEKEAKRYKEIDMSEHWPKDRCTIERIHRPTRERFIKDFATKQKPVIITGLMDDWIAMDEWHFDKLESALFKGVKVDIMDELSPYQRWNDCRRNVASSLRHPPKIHMTNFHELYPELMDHVKIPDLFREDDDFLQLIDSDIRPRQLSFNMEPKRSGYHWRVEVINGSIWSALVQGHKRWGLYHPHVFFPPGVVHNRYQTQDDQSSDPYTWWAHTQPHLHVDRQPLECVQRPGEILYIPSGWWWSYINLEDSIGLQRWFCDKYSLRACLDELKEQSDSSPDNRYADIFVQLRHHLNIDHPKFLSKDDREFQSSVSGLGKSFEELEEQLSVNKYKEYFGKYDSGDVSAEEDVTDDSMDHLN